MIICHVITSLVYGGAERLLLNLVKLQKQKHTVYIIYFLAKAPLLSFFPKDVNIYHIRFNLLTPYHLRQYIKKIKPDIVHTHLGHADLIGLWSIRGLNVKSFVTIHNIWYKWDWRDPIIFFIYKILFKTIARKCVVIGISKSVSLHVKNRLGVKTENIFTLYNAIEDIHSLDTKENIRKKLNLPEQSFCVLFIGRLHIQKSIETLLFSINIIKNKIPNLVIQIVGEGEEEKKLKKIVNQLQITEIVKFYGTTSDPELFLQAADLFVLPSVYEGFGIVIIEAFRAGLPVIATNIEGPREIITNDINGLLFSPLDYEALANLIFEVYSNLDLRNNLSQESRMSFTNEYSIVNYAERLESIYLL